VSVKRKSRNHKPQPTRSEMGVRILLISSALVLVAAIASVFFRESAQTPKSATIAQSKPIPNTSPVAAAISAPGNPAAPAALSSALVERTFPMLDGKSHRLADYAGKVVVVDVWATWCGPCRAEIPHLIELAKEFKGQGVEVIGLTTENPATDSQTVREFARQFKINYPIGWANGEFASGLMNGRDTIPQTYVIGRDGKVRKHFVGFNAQTSPPQLRAAIKEAASAG
jgi:thiol-disulfide isomerase/thioredoxin